MVGRALRRAPANFSSRIRSGGAGRVPLTGLNFNDGPGGATSTVPAGLLGVVSLSGCFGTALADVALLLYLGLLGRLGPSGHGRPQLRHLRHEVHGRQRLRRRVRRAACPGLKGLSRGKLHRILGDGPGAGNQGTRVKDNRIEKSTNHANPNYLPRSSTHALLPRGASSSPRHRAAPRRLPLGRPPRVGLVARGC